MESIKHEDCNQCALQIVFARLQRHDMPKINLVVCIHEQASKMSGIQLSTGEYVKPLPGRMYDYPLITYQTKSGAAFCAIMSAQFGKNVLYIGDQGNILEFCGGG